MHRTVNHFLIYSEFSFASLKLSSGDVAGGGEPTGHRTEHSKSSCGATKRVVIKGRSIIEAWVAIGHRAIEMIVKGRLLWWRKRVASWERETTVGELVITINWFRLSDKSLIQLRSDSLITRPSVDSFVSFPVAWLYVNHIWFHRLHSNMEPNNRTVSALSIKQKRFP